MKYLDWLNNGYNILNNEDKSKKEYLSDYIFNFVTNDSEMAELFAEKAIEVCKAITYRFTFDYIKDQECYKWFIVMCNMPFFSDKINWGTSVRAAWWDDKIFYTSFGLFENNGEQIEKEIIFDKKEWIEFIESIIEFTKQDKSIK